MEAQNEGLVLGVEANPEMLNVRVQSPCGSAIPPQMGEGQYGEQNGAEKLQPHDDLGRNKQVRGSVRELPCDNSLRDGSQGSEGEKIDTPPQTLEDRMLVVVGSNYMNLSLVASLLKVEENAVRAVAESSDKFRVSGTGKSICKTDAL